MHQTDEGINPSQQGVVRLQASLRTSFWEPMVVLVWRELRVRYKRTALGFFWSLAPPIAQAFLWLIVVKWFLGVKVPNFSANKNAVPDRIAAKSSPTRGRIKA